jgi:hypothetical protein
VNYDIIVGVSVGTDLPDIRVVSHRTHCGGDRLLLHVRHSIVYIRFNYEIEINLKHNIS